MNSNTLYFALMALFLTSITSTSQASQTEEKLPFYKLELIVFETTALKGWTEEYWPQEDPLSLEDVQPKKPLPRKYFMLKEVAHKMLPSKGYHIIFHQAWLLKGKPENQAKPILIENLPQNKYQTQLTGQLFFYKSHYNHADLQLQIEKYIPIRIKAKFAKHEQINLDQLPDTWRFNIQESRKLRPGQLHYIDHPIFGALIKIKYLPNLGK